MPYRYVCGRFLENFSNCAENRKDIAYSLNFTNMSFFGKYFKRYVGISPLEYRNS